MQKIEKTKQHASVLQLAAASSLVLLFLAVTHVEKAECLISAADAPPCNSTRISDCLPDDDEEFSMESEISRRILQGGKTITYSAQNPSRLYCNRDVYGSCIGPESKIYTKRPCNYQNTCNRPGH